MNKEEKEKMKKKKMKHNKIALILREESKFRLFKQATHTHTQTERNTYIQI